MGNFIFYKAKEIIQTHTKKFYDLKANDIDGNEVHFSRYKENKLILVVNVASKCGLTKKNYVQLRELYEKY